MNSAYNHQDEPIIIELWDQHHIAKPNWDRLGKPYSILMPPPNANASLHAGHAMYVIQDIMIRFKRLQGYAAAWLPGTDHAGFETQVVYEKHLKKQGKSRFDFDRQSLYNQIADFVQENSGLIINQMKRLGFSADWQRKTFTLDEKVVKTVYQTFTQLHEEGLIYRDNYLVNYCPSCGTTFADLEIDHQETTSPLYYVEYRFADGEPRIINGETMLGLVVATVRPETIFADVALALHPQDPRAQALAGELVLNPLTREAIPVIADDFVDREFGTGVVKITPAHDANDFACGRRHNLPAISIISRQGRLDLSALSSASAATSSRLETLRLQFDGLKVKPARAAVANLLKTENSVVKIDENYANRVTVCYKGNHPIEPLLIPNWFMRMESLAQLGLDAVAKKEVTFFPTRFTKQYQNWLENIRDWPLSRQIVWGIPIPAWYNVAENPEIELAFLNKQGERVVGTYEQLKDDYQINEIRDGLQELRAPIAAQPTISIESPGENYLPETDTFDTWFSSGQWPLVTLGYPDGEDFKSFFPTQLLDTMWDILFFWVARMIMLSKHLTGKVPFQQVYLHSMVTDAKGAKMSKSKGNVINPIDLVDKYGADALRIALIAGAAPGNPVSLSEPKVKGYRNFANKVWNMGRFLSSKFDVSEINWMKNIDLSSPLWQERNVLINQVTNDLEKLRFSEAALALYEFMWNRLANEEIEKTKNGASTSQLATLLQIYLDSLILLHPFMPFVTEAVWQELQPNTGVLALSTWPVPTQSSGV